MNNFKVNDGKVLKLNESLWNGIFTKDKDNDRNYIQEILLRYSKKRTDNLFTKYKDIKDAPIWSICLSWTFGDTVKIFEYLCKDLKYNILKSYNCFKDINEFEAVFKILKNIRNRVAHNNVIYNFFKKDEKNQINKFLNRNKILNKKTNKILISHIILLIDKICGKKLNNYNLWNKFQEITDKLIIQSKYIHKDIIDKILKCIGYTILINNKNI